MANTQGNEAILLSHDASNACWQLGPLPPRQGLFTLVGWTMEESDGAVPPSVVNALARALIRYGRVTFPCSTVPPALGSGWHPRGADIVGAFSRRTIDDWSATFAAPRDGSELGLLSTVSEESVRGLFDDPAYPWWYQGQFALVSRPAESPPDLAAHQALLHDLIEPEWAEALEELSTIGVHSILRPGVDGDVAGFLCASLAVRQELEDGIRTAAADFGLACRIASEEVFSALLAGAPHNER